MNIDTGETEDWIDLADAQELDTLIHGMGYELGPRELFVFGDPELVAELSQKLKGAK